MLSTVAALAASDAVVSSWKLESSSTQRSGRLPESSRRISASRTAGPMFPATSQSLPAARAIAPAERGHGGLAVGARHRDDPRALAQRLREQFDIADGTRPGGERTLHVRLGERQAGADRDQVDAVETFLPERAARGGNRRQRAAQRRELRRLGARVGDAHARAAAREPLRHRQSRVTQAEHQRLSARETHRSFNVERPNSTSIMVMIQKRTTT